MRHFLTYLSLSFLFLFSYVEVLEAQTFNWVKGGGSTSTLSIANDLETVYATCTDPHGNLYALCKAGTGAPIVADTFDRPTGAYGSDHNVLFVSYDCSGQMRFAKLFSSLNTYPLGLTTDNSGHVYVAIDAAHNSSGPYVLRLGYDTTITAFNYETELLVQYDTSGHLNWGRFTGDNLPSTYSGTLTNSGCFLAMDATDNVHFVSILKYGVHITPTITSHWGTYDLKYDVTGTLVAVNKLQLDSSLIVDGGTIDKQSNKMYVYGYRNIYMFPDSSDYNYIAALDVSRNLIWKDSVAHPYTSPLTGMISGLAADGMGHLYIGVSSPQVFVYHGDTVKNDLATGPETVSSIMKLDTSGNTFWTRKYSSSAGVSGIYRIALMPNNKIAAGGAINGGYMVGGTDTVHTFSGALTNAIFTIVDSGGYVQSFQQLHGTGDNNASNSLVSDAVGNLYVGGEVESSVWAGALTPYTSVGGDSDYFITKFGIDCSCTTMPVANYTVTGTVTKTFTYTGTTVAIDSVRWEFGDGTTSTMMNPTHTYTTGDTFTACITVYTACGSDMHCSDFIIPCITAPTASFTMSGTGLTRTFTYTGTGLGTGTLSWNFWDGTSAGAGTPVTHTFSAAATYNVCLTATNSCGANIACTMTTVTCTTPPTSAFTISGTGASRSFTYTGTTAGLDSVTWTYGDAATGTGLTPGHTYAAPGIYNVCATAHTNCGIATMCHTVNIACTAAPIAAFTFSGTGAAISFNYTGTTAALDSVRWDFGDGGTSTSLAPGHTYIATGTYHVCVTAYTSCGINTICHDVTITCVATITASFTDTGNAVHGFAYTGTTTGLDSVVWNFGDSHSDTGIIRIHTYASSDTYHVCVIVYTDCGNDTVCKDVIVLHSADVTDISLADIKVYPNPATNELSITGIQRSTGYRILTITGITLQQGTLQQGTNTVLLKQTAPGIYVLEMTGINGQKNIVRIVKE
jgi:PKD repeat protein